MTTYVLTLWMTEPQYQKLLRLGGASGGMEDLVEVLRLRVEVLRGPGYQFARVALPEFTLIERFARYRDAYGTGTWQRWMRSMVAVLVDVPQTFVLSSWPEIKVKIYEGTPTQPSFLEGDPA